MCAGLWGQEDCWTEEGGEEGMVGEEEVVGSGGTLSVVIGSPNNLFDGVC